MDNLSLKIAFFGNDSARLENAFEELYYDKLPIFKERIDLSEFKERMIKYFNSYIFNFNSTNLEIGSRPINNGVFKVLTLYFTHLYSVIDFIDTRTFLNENKKYFYSGILIPGFQSRYRK